MMPCGKDPVHAAIPPRKDCRPNRCRGLPSPQLTSTGRFSAGKAPEVLVAALALLTAPPAYPVSDCPTRQAVIRLVAACGLDRRARLPSWPHNPARSVAGASRPPVPRAERPWFQAINATPPSSIELDLGREVLSGPDH
jgi:hypothetical protein